MMNKTKKLLIISASIIALLSGCSAEPKIEKVETLRVPMIATQDHLSDNFHVFVKKIEKSIVLNSSFENCEKGPEDVCIDIELSSVEEAPLSIDEITVSYNNRGAAIKVLYEAAVIQKQNESRTYMFYMLENKKANEVVLYAVDEDGDTVEEKYNLETIIEDVMDDCEGKKIFSSQNFDELEEECYKSEYEDEYIYRYYTFKDIMEIYKDAKTLHNRYLPYRDY